MIRIRNYIAIGLLAMGLTVAAAWHLQWELLHTPIADGVSMKYPTAVLFACFGVAFLASRSAPGFANRLIMGTMFLTAILAFSFVGTSFEGEDAPLSVRPDMPSYGTLFGFFMLGLAALAENHNSVALHQWLGGVVGAVGLVAIVGYLTARPALYLFFEGRSSAMAIHTAIGLVTASVWFQIKPPSLQRKAVANG